jgi:hypothetical protein
MKYVGITALGLVLLAAIGGVALWANMPTAKLSVHAVRPMGTNFTWLDRSGNEQRWPVWVVTITNSGTATAAWATQLVLDDGHSMWVHEWREGGLPTTGHLLPGGWTTSELPMPSGSTSVCAAVVRYASPKGRVETNLFNLCKPVPKLRDLLPNRGSFLAYPIWGSTTNVTTAH